jgi:hypothetical protein
MSKGMDAYTMPFLSDADMSKTAAVRLMDMATTIMVIMYCNGLLVI